MSMGSCKSRKNGQTIVMSIFCHRLTPFMRLRSVINSVTAITTISRYVDMVERVHVYINPFENRILFVVPRNICDSVTLLSNTGASIIKANCKACKIIMKSGDGSIYAVMSSQTRP